MLTHTSAEFAAMSRCIALLVGVLDARGIVDGRAFAANVRVVAGDIAECKEHMEMVAELVTGVIKKYEDEGAIGLKAVDPD